METENEMLINFINYDMVIILLARLALNLIVVSAIVIPKFILKQRKEFAISLYLFNFVIFVLCYVLSKTEMGWTAGIGLFAVFSMLRFRSEMLKLIDMTYLLIIVSIGFINATFNGAISFIEIILLNLGLYMMIFALDHILSQPKLKCKKIKYGNLELIKPDENAVLVKDLKEKTGLKIEKVCIDSINLNENYANILVYFHENEKNNGHGKNSTFMIKKSNSVFKRKHILENT